MSWQLSRDQVKALVAEALTAVADVSGDIEVHDFSKFTDFHEKVFLNRVRELLLAKRYTMQYEGQEFEFCYTITLNEDMIDKWASVGACIDHITRKQQIMEAPARLELG